MAHRKSVNSFGSLSRLLQTAAAKRTVLSLESQEHELQCRQGVHCEQIEDSGTPKDKTPTDKNAAGKSCFFKN